MKLGITRTALGAKGLREVFQRAAEIGAEGLEVSYQTDNDARALTQANHPKQLVKLSRTCGVAVPSLALGVLCKRASLIGTDSQIAEAKKMIRQALFVAAEAGAKVVQVPFFGKNAIEVEDELSQAADALLDLVESAEEASVVIGLESTLNFDQQEFLLNHLGNTGDVKIYVDTGDALARKLDVASGIRNLGGDAIAQIHFKDVHISEGQPPDFNVALGEGSVDFQAVAQALRAIGYDGWAVVETAPGDDPLAAARANLEFARKVIAAAQ